MAAVLPAQSATPEIQFGVPRRFMNLRPMPFSVWVFHWLVATARPSGPYCSTTLRSFSAIASSASSQPMRRHSPEPRSPVRSSG